MTNEHDTGEGLTTEDGFRPSSEVETPEGDLSTPLEDREDRPSGEDPRPSSEVETPEGDLSTPLEDRGDRPSGEDPRPSSEVETPDEEHPVRTPEEIAGAVEALLLMAEEPIQAATIAAAVDVPVDVVSAALQQLRDFYDETGRGFELRHLGGGWRYYTRAEHADVISAHVLSGQQSKLSQAALETLAVIAYRQPISRARVSAVRGVNVDGVVRTLLARNVIAESGQDTETGAVLFVTTDHFLERMGLDSLDELPPLAPHLPEVAEMEAELADLAGPSAGEPRPSGEEPRPSGEEPRPSGEEPRPSSEVETSEDDRLSTSLEGREEEPFEGREGSLEGDEVRSSSGVETSEDDRLSTSLEGREEESLEGREEEPFEDREGSLEGEEPRPSSGVETSEGEGLSTSLEGRKEQVDD